MSSAWALAHKDHLREYRQANKEHLAERGRQWRAANIEKRKAGHAAYYQANRERELEAQHIYREANKERINARNRARRERIKADPDLDKREKAVALARRTANPVDPELSRERTRQWKAANPVLVNEMNARRRVQRRGNGVVEKIDLSLIWERDEGCCYLCGLPVDCDNWHLDHKTPISKGGSHTYDNVAVTHPPCNQRKYNRTEAEYREWTLSRGGVSQSQL
jgi:HNH endonuclease